MISLRKTFLVLLMLWFPFYTGAAAAMVVCKQTLAAPVQSTASDSAASPHAMHSQHGTDAQHHDDSTAQHNHYTAKDCNQCGLCHVACAPWVGSAAVLSFAGEPQQYMLLDLNAFRSNLAPPSSRPPAS